MVFMNEKKQDMWHRNFALSGWLTYVCRGVQAQALAGTKYCLHIKIEAQVVKTRVRLAVKLIN